MFDKETNLSLKQKAMVQTAGVIVFAFGFFEIIKFILSVIPATFWPYFTGFLFFGVVCYAIYNVLLCRLEYLSDMEENNKRYNGK
jgi:Na+/glutamate symporter